MSDRNSSGSNAAWSRPARGRHWMGGVRILTVGPVEAVVIGSSAGAEDDGPDGARQIRRRLRRVLETRR